MKIVVVMKALEKHREELKRVAPKAEFLYVPINEVQAEQIADADIIIGNVPANLLAGAHKLQWLQLNSAGTDAYIKPGVMPAGVKLTNATGAYGLALSEHMTAQLLAMMKKLYIYYDNQKEGKWQDEGKVKSIYGSKVLVVGMGDIGGEFAKRMKALGAQVTGIRRRVHEIPDYVDAMGEMANLDSYLAEADIVASSLPGTKATYHLFNEERFNAMKKGSYFLNIGRGGAVDTDALVKTMKAGHLAGAALDVTEPEPLPKEHPLWKTPNVYITPHISGDFHLDYTHDRIIDIAAKNLELFLAGKPLKNEVDFSTGYKK